MDELNLIYLGRIRIRALDLPSISLEHLYASDDMRAKDTNLEYVRQCASNGVTVAVNFHDVDLVGLGVRLAIFLDESMTPIPTVILGDGRVIDWKARSRNLDLDPPRLETTDNPEHASRMKALVVAVEELA